MNIPSLLFALGRVSAQAALLVLLILVIDAVSRRRLAPAWRCALWLLVAARLLIPFSWSSEASVFNFVTISLPPEMTAAADGAMAPAVPRISPLAAVPLAPQPRTSRSEFSWSQGLLEIWLGGAAVLGGYLLLTSLRFQRRLRDSVPVTDPAFLGALEECRRSMGVVRAPGAWETDLVATPALCGFLRPRLLLPRGFISALSPRELQFVLLHELAHVRRFDLPVNWLLTGLQIVHWFNPLVWLGFARWRADRELACDALALEVAGPEQIKPYGETILRLLQGIAPRAPAPGLVGISEDPRQLRRRIGMIARFQPGSRWSLAGALVVAAVAVCGLTNARSQPAPAAPADGSPPAAVGKMLAAQQTDDAAREAAAAAARAKLEQAKRAEEEARQRASAAARVRGHPDSNYRLQVGDRVHISVFREETLTTSQRIENPGIISLGLAGDVHLAGLTLSEARKELEEAYRKSGALKEPIGVTLSIEEYMPQTVSITGQIKNPGRFQLPVLGEPLSVVELVMKAGGFTDIAKGNDVMITHAARSTGQKTVIHVDVQAIIRGQSTIQADDPSLILSNRDIVYVPEKVI